MTGDELKRLNPPKSGLIKVNQGEKSEDDDEDEDEDDSPQSYSVKVGQTWSKLVKVGKCLMTKFE